MARELREVYFNFHQKNVFYILAASINIHAFRPMKSDLISRYAWIVDTITRYGCISRQKLNELWVKSSLSDGKPIPHRTFFHHRRAIEEQFHLDIKCNSFGEYYIEKATTPQDESLRKWLLDSNTVRGIMADSTEIAERIMLEEIPSARLFLPAVMEAIKGNNKLMFSYLGFNRSKREQGIVFHPYFVRLYKQRWYVIGLKEKDSSIRTYALDRADDMRILSENFSLPENSDPSEFFDGVIGITLSKSAPVNVRIRTNSIRAKYLRALPLHHSQSEENCGSYSIFTYRLRINYELVHEIISYGSSVEVLSPKQLRAMVVDELQKTLDNY